MKKLFYLFIVAMCATMFSACSDDDKDPLDDEEGKEGVITAVISYYNEFGWIETFEEGDIITIDWGDGNVEEFKSFEYHDEYDEEDGEIHYVVGNDEDNEDVLIHEYPDDKPYNITIKGKIKEVNFGCYLISLDISKCPALQGLANDGHNNYDITSLDLSKNTELTSLWLDAWELTSLDVSKCTKLIELDCGNNLTSLDVSKNTALTVLYCGGNNLTSLDVSKNTALTVLYCGGNNLTSLDVSKNTALTYLECGTNELTSLNVSKCTALTELRCYYNKLSSAALNQIFRDLPQATYGHININDNPGTDTCDKSIAENKGWKVSTAW